MVAFWATSAAAITIEINYSTDTSGFFGAGNLQGAAAGAQAKAAMDEAAAFYNGILEDTFSAIDPPSKFYGSLGGEASFFWKRRYTDPATGNNSAAVNIDIEADKYVVFVGARDLLDDNTLGLGGAGGYVDGFVVKNGLFTDAEQTQINQMKNEFSDAVTMRGQSTGFGLWGGSIAFNSTKDWHFDHATDPTAGTQDFYSVALHELAHTLGFGASDDDDSKDTPWEALVSGTEFTGTKAIAAYVLAGNVPLESANDTAHWSSTIVDSTVYGSGVAQEPLMTPGLDSAMRHVLTNLDAAALADLGWEIDLPGGAAAAAASFVSTSGSSGSASVAALRASAVPEPSGMMLMLFVSMTALLVEPRRRRWRAGNGSIVPRS